MTVENQKENWGISKKITIFLLFMLLVWEGFISYQIYGFSKLFEEYEPANYKVGFMISMQPFSWIIILLTLGAILDIAKRKQFLILNSILVIAIIILANTSLSFFIVMESWEPIFNMESK